MTHDTKLITVAEPQAWIERFFAAFLRGFLRLFFRPFIGPPYGAVTQRRLVAVLATLMPGRGGVQRQRRVVNDVSVEIVAPRSGPTLGAMLYLHGGAFCLGNPRSHRSITSHLAFAAGIPVWVPDYRLAPEHPYPAALDDALACYRTLRSEGYRADQIVIAGDSAGGALALSLALALRQAGETAPAALALISPVTDAQLGGETITSRANHDPMIRHGWVEQGIGWYAAPSGPGTSVLDQDLSGLPPMMIQVGDQEILLSDSTRLARRAADCDVPCELQIHLRRWHVFHLQTFYLRSAVRALQSLGGFAKARVAAGRAVIH